MRTFARFGSIILLLVFSGIFAEFVVPPAPAGRVLDEVSLLSSSDKQTLEQALLALETETHHQIGIAIIKSLQDRSIEEAGLAIARTWGIGQSGLDNGILILVAPTEREMRLEIGRGLEGVMTDLTSHRIIDEYLKPAFQREEYFKGLLSVIDVMTPILRGETVELPVAENFPSDMAGPILFLILFFGWSFLSILSASKSWWLGGIFGGVIGLGLSGIYGIPIGLLAGLLLDFVLSKYAYKKIPLVRNFQSRHPGGFGGGFGGGSSGGFGGGGFGGGGASGRW